MNTQRGGSFTVSGYIALALLALSVLEAVYVTHLLKHRVIQIVMPYTQPQTNVTKI